MRLSMKIVVATLKRRIMDEQLIKSMLLEDAPGGDITSNAIFKKQKSLAKLISKDDGVICGCEYFEQVFNFVDANTQIKWLIKDGDIVVKGQLLAELSGETKSLLLAERTALNILQHLSGISTNTFQYTKLFVDTDIEILDTRKTLPLYRKYQKYAVTIGGGHNHRFSLSDMAMIKDNHIKAAGSLAKAVELVRAENPNVQIITECESITQVKECILTSTDIIMLDNMTNEQMSEACKIIGTKKQIEASGNMNLKRIKEIKNLPLNRISIGELTHSVKAFDISLKF